jgi:hypothetical protein
MRLLLTLNKMNMKKIFITLLVLALNINSSFAEPINLWAKMADVSKKPLNNEMQLFISKSQLKCSVVIKAEKENAFITTTRCTSSSKIECLILTDTKNFVEEYYCLDPLTTLQLNLNLI